MTPTSLDGGAHPIDLGDGVRLTAPGVEGAAVVSAGDPGGGAGAEGGRGPARLKRAAGTAESGSTSDALITPSLAAALEGQGVTVVRSVIVDPRALAAPPGAADAAGRRRRRGPATDAADGQVPADGAPLALEVPPPPPGSAQVVLAVDQDGAVSWHLPDAPAGGARTLRRGPTGAAAPSQRFTVPARFAPPDERPAAPGVRVKRSVGGAIGRMVLRTLVYPLTDPVAGAAGEHFARRWEEAHRPEGVRRFTPEGYRRAGADRMTGEGWRAMAGGRALLFIHGTFSTAHDAFGALRPDTMDQLYARYGGRVFAVNMFTLSADPTENAERILRHVPPGVALDVDVVCHSRGGLVARALAELAAGRGTTSNGRTTGGPGTLRVHRVVFVAAPNAGTQLADPDHMVAMIDRFTSALNLAPAGPVAATLESIVTAVKVLGHGALNSLIGLAAMDPGGAYLKAIGRLGGGAEYFAIAADYSPPAGGGLFQLVARRVGDRAVDRIFGEAANDLVVPLAGVSSANGCAGFPFPATACYGFAAARGVMHTRYFGEEETSARLLAWLTPDGAGERIAVVGGELAVGERAGGAGTRPKRGAPTARPGAARPGARNATRSTRSPEPAPPKRRAAAKAPARPARARTHGVAGGEETTARRFPSITSSHTATPGRPFDVVVDLAREAEAHTASKGVVIGGLQAGWETEAVEVRVDSPALAFARGRDAGTIYVHRAGPSQPCTLAARVRPDATPDADGNVVVYASFFHGGRLCGTARRAFPLAPKRGAKAAAKQGSAKQTAMKGAAAPSAQTQGAAAIELGALAPKLTVVIFPPDPEGRLYWRLEFDDAADVPGLPDRRAELCTIGKDPAAFAAGLYAQADAVTPGQHRSLFNGIGEQLFEATPPCFRQAYWALRAKYGRDFAIQFVSGEPHIPWEFMRPVDRPAGRAEQILCLDHPVGRWLLDFEGTMRARLPAGDVVTVAPDYAGRGADVARLAAAQDEAAMLVKQYKARRVEPATHAQLLTLLHAADGARPVAVLHFAGHGEFDRGAANGSRVLLADGDLRVNDVRSVDTQLGRRFGTFVVFNACEVGRGTRVLDTIGGWAEAFLHERFGGFVAPLWPAYDVDAEVVMREFFDGAVAGRRPLGEVMRDIRERHADESPTFLSYMYYGDVMGRFG